MKTTVTLNVGQGIDPFSHNTTRPKRGIVREFRGLLKAVVQGGLALRLTRPTLLAGTARATGTVIAASAAAADTITVNGTAITAEQERATGTATFSTIVAGNVVTLNGVAFTARAVPTLANEFALGATDTTAAAALAAAVNACTDVLVSGLIAATSAAGVVTFRAVAIGTAANAYTLAKTGSPISVSNTTLLGGLARGNNKFDISPGATDAQVAAEIALCLASSSTALIIGAVEAANWAGTFTLASVTEGEYVMVGGVKFTARSAAASNVLTDFDISGTDTADAAALVVCINAHPTLKDVVFASSAVGVVTVRQLGANSAAALILGSSGAHITTVDLAQVATVLISSLLKGVGGNQATLASSNNTRLAVSGARLTGGTTTTYTF